MGRPTVIAALVVVADKEWECTATYKGTNSSTDQSVEDGTASEPTCSKVG